MKVRLKTICLRSRRWFSVCASLLLVALVEALGQAPIVDDASLGVDGGELESVFDVIVIDSGLGQTVGDNLFHSFSRFNVPAGSVAAFFGPATIQNVIARVSGSEASRIAGTVHTVTETPTANCLLLNPNGIIFGPDSWVDIGGSATFSTADQIHFADGRLFPAQVPVSEDLSSAPVASFGFLDQTPRDIRLNGSWILLGESPYQDDEDGNTVLVGSLDAPPQNLSLVAGNIHVEGGSTVIATAVNLVAVGDAAADSPPGARTVVFDPNDRESLPAASASGRITLDHSYLEGAVIRMLGGDFQIGLSDVFAYDTDATGLGISLQSAGRIDAMDSFISAYIGTGGLMMRAHDISLRRGDNPAPYIEVSTLALDSLPGRRAGDVSLEARDSITIEGYSVFSNAEGEHSSGNVSVLAGGTLRLSESLGQRPDIGEISTIAANSRRPQTGPDDKVGNVTVTAGRIEIVGAAEISSSSFLYLDGGLELADFDFARSGDVTVYARDGITIDGRKPAGLAGGGVIGGLTGIFSQFPGETRLLSSFLEGAEGPAVGDAGDVRIQVDGTSGLTLMNGARISSSGSRIDRGLADSHSDAGRIDIATPTLTIDGGGARSGIFSEGFLRSQSAHSGGGITIRGAKEVRITNGGEISSRSALELAGDIRLIDFQPNSRVTLDGGRLTALSGGDGAAGGNIFIANPRALILRDSEINSSALGSGGRGGNIALSSTIFLRQNSILDASSRSGVSGAVTGANIPINLSDVVNPVQAESVGDSLTLPERSAVFRSRDISGHAVAGRGRRPSVPERYQLSFEGEGEAASTR